MDVANDVAPLLSKERADEPGGLWATKQYGDLKEGDRLRAADYVTGSVEVRQLRSVYKLSFTDIVRVNRFKPVGVQEVGAGSDEGSDGSVAALKRAEREQNASVRLYVFLTKKKAKTRMTDLEETAFLLRMDVGKEGCICFGKSFGDFDQGMLQVPNPTGYKGIVIAKRKADEPATDEPIVYAYARIVQRRRPVAASEVVLGLAEDKDRVTRYTKAAPSVKSDDELLKGVRKYARTARKAWEAMSIPEDQNIDFEGFKQAFDELNLVILEGKALRLFQTCDLGGTGTIGISELEVALMIHDVVPTTSYLTPMDSFNVFDLDGGGDISWVEFKEATEVIARGNLTEAQAKELFDKVDTDKSGVIEYEEFKQAWLEMVDVEQEIKARGKKTAFGPMSSMRNKKILAQAVENEDRETIQAFEMARERVESVRKRARLLRDEKKKKKVGRGGKSNLADANEDATRKRQRRLMMKKEQAERSRQRMEQKIKQNELQQQLAAKKDRDATQIKQQMVQQEKERIAGIRARGDDQLWLSHMNLRQIPSEFYQDPEWRGRLVDLVLLDLQDNRLVDLPPDFLADMVSLRKLDINKNRLSALADEQLSNLEHLQVLNVSRNELRELPPALGKLSKLQHLVISKNEISQLPEELGGMHSLRSLRAHANDLETLPASVGGLVSLELCDLSSNRLMTLPNDFSYATALTRLDLSSNRLRHLPLDFGLLFSLQLLDVSCNQLADLPSSVSTLKSLQILNVGENAVVEVAGAWGGMTSLVELEAQKNRIGRISPGIGELLQLQRLDLCQNIIEELPSTIGLLTQLHDLNLRSNHIAEIPDELGALKQLNTLSLAYNSLERRLPDHLGLLTRLTDLDLSSNKIGYLPPSLGALEASARDLETLNVSRNVLSTLPQNFTFLTSLTELDLSCNRFKDIPLLLCGMKALRQLDLTSNVISHLPKEIEALTTLTKLHLRHDLLRSLPLETVSLEKHVRDLNLEQNPLPVLPDKWHLRFGPKQEASRPAGYTKTEVFEWVRAQRMFHDQATEEWEQKAGLYVTGRASAKEFVEGVRSRVGDDVWRPYLEPHVLRLFFRAKKNGLPDAYHKISEAEAAEREHIAAELSAAREDLVALTAADVEARMDGDARGKSPKAVVADAQLAEGRRLRRICSTKRGVAL
ncbi:unnamed protein product [Scytosiphon promiscuus]